MCGHLAGVQTRQSPARTWPAHRPLPPIIAPVTLPTACNATGWAAGQTGQTWGTLTRRNAVPGAAQAQKPGTRRRVGGLWSTPEARQGRSLTPRDCRAPSRVGATYSISRPAAGGGAARQTGLTLHAAEQGPWVARGGLGCQVLTPYLAGLPRSRALQKRCGVYGGSREIWDCRSRNACRP